MVLIKHNAVRSKQHSFIAQLSARVQEVYYFASLVYRCQLHAHRAADVKNYEHIQYTVIINTKTDRKSKEIKHGAVKKKKKLQFSFYCFVLNLIKIILKHASTHIHLYLNCGESVEHYTACSGS